MFSNRIIIANTVFFSLILIFLLNGQSLRAQCFVTVNIGCDWSMLDDCQSGLAGPCDGKDFGAPCGTEFEFSEFSFKEVNIEIPGQSFYAYDGDKNCGRYKSCFCEGLTPLFCTPEANWHDRLQPQYIAFGPWCDF
jgi:hypothetical protein